MPTFTNKTQMFYSWDLRILFTMIFIIHRSTTQVLFFFLVYLLFLCQKANKSNNQNERMASTELGTIKMENKDWYYDGGKKWKALKYITITLE